MSRMSNTAARATSRRSPLAGPGCATNGGTAGRSWMRTRGRAGRPGSLALTAPSSALTCQEQAGSRCWRSGSHQQHQRRAPGAGEAGGIGRLGGGEDRAPGYWARRGGRSETSAGVKVPSTISSGAVSPAARATARIVPVRMPLSALGGRSVRIARQRLTPSASAASRRVRGTSSRTSWLVRAMSGSMMIASAIDPAKPESACSGLTSRPNANSPITTDGSPCMRSSASRSARPEATAGRRTPPGRWRSAPRWGWRCAAAMATISAVPMIAERIPPPGPLGGGSLIRKSRLSAGAPRAITA